MSDRRDEAAFVERLRREDDDEVIHRLRLVEGEPDSYRPGILEALRAELARRGLSVAEAAARPEADDEAPPERDAARHNMLTGLLFLLVSGLGLAVLRSTGWYDEADLVGGPLGTLGLVLLLKGLWKA